MLQTLITLILTASYVRDDLDIFQGTLQTL